MDQPDQTIAGQASIEAGDETEEQEEFPPDEAQQRLWLRAIASTAEMLGKMPTEAVHEPRVRLAVDMALVAACERIGRICKSDLEAE
jgi:hypothetical protein